MVFYKAFGLLVLIGSASFALASVPSDEPECNKILAHAEVEVSETEAKFLLPDLTKIPADILLALQRGASHPSILRRGFVVQEYLDRVRKTYFEILATDSSGNTLRRKDGAPYSVEVDMFIGNDGLSAGPIFINGEIEFHGATKTEAVAEALNWQTNGNLRPPYFSHDLTEVPGVKSRDIGLTGTPLLFHEILTPHLEMNTRIFQAISHEFLLWVDPAVGKLVSSP